MHPETETVANTARQLFAQRHRYWAKPLIDSLAAEQALTAIEWAIPLFQKLLRGKPSLVRAVLALKVALPANDQVTVADLEQESRQLWYGPRDLDRRAVARLYGATSVLLKGDFRAFKSELIRAVCLLCDRIDGQWDSVRADTAIKQFIRRQVSGRR
jgi:hypothetical protein